MRPKVNGNMDRGRSRCLRTLGAHAEPPYPEVHVPRVLRVLLQARARRLSWRYRLVSSLVRRDFPMSAVGRYRSEKHRHSEPHLKPRFCDLPPLSWRSRPAIPTVDTIPPIGTIIPVNSVFSINAANPIGTVSTIDTIPPIPAGRSGRSRSACQVITS